jgi:hypothetical protein
MALNSSMRTLTHQQQQQYQQQYHSQTQPGSWAAHQLAIDSGSGSGSAGGSAVGQLLSKATVMDAIKQVGRRAQVGVCFWPEWTHQGLRCVLPALFAGPCTSEHMVRKCNCHPPDGVRHL